MTKPTRIFRQHDEAPDNIASPLYAQLTREWAALHGQVGTTATVRRWGRTEPVLSPYSRPGDIVDAIDAADHEETDALLLALIRLFHAGQQLAGRIVLQALLPKLVKINQQVTIDTAVTDSWNEDRRHTTVAEFWSVLADYPVARRVERVASNLVLNTLHQVTEPLRAKPRVAMTHPDPLPRFTGSRISRTADAGSWLHVHTQVEPDPAHDLADELSDSLCADADLRRVTTWALNKNVITKEEARLLTVVYLSDLSDETKRCRFDIAAEQLGLSEPAIRKRCSRIARKLTTAIRTEMLREEPEHRQRALQVA